MIYDRRGFTKEELIIIIREFSEYLDESLLQEYSDNLDSMADMEDSEYEEDS